MSLRCCSVAILEASHLLLHCNSALPGAPFTFSCVCRLCAQPWSILSICELRKERQCVTNIEGAGMLPGPACCS
jgi:hypothetical protein